MRLCKLANKASEHTIIRLYKDSNDDFLGEFTAKGIPRGYHQRRVVGFIPTVAHNSFTFEAMAVLDVIIEVEEDN